MKKRLALTLLASLWTTAVLQAGLAPAGQVKMRKGPLFSTLGHDGQKLFVVCFADSDVAVFKHGSAKYETSFYGGHEPQGIAMTPTGDKLFVTNRRGLVKVIDASSYQVIDDIKVGGLPSNIAMSPGGLQAFVTNYGRGKIGRIDFIDTSTHRILGVAEIGIRPLQAAVSPLGDQLFVACAGSNEIYVLNINSRKVVKQIPVGLGPNGLAFSPDGSYLYVSNAGTNDLSVVDTLDLEELKRVPVGNSPFSIAADKKGRLFVVETGDRSLSLYSPDFQKLSSVKAGKKPIDVQLSSDERHAYVTDESGNKVFVFNVD